jgi:hypothetical protein
MAANKQLPKNVSQSTRVTDRFHVQRKHRGLTKSGLNTAGKDQENEAIEKT